MTFYLALLVPLACSSSRVIRIIAKQHRYWLAQVSTIVSPRLGWSAGTRDGSFRRVAKKSVSCNRKSALWPWLTKILCRRSRALNFRVAMRSARLEAFLSKSGLLLVAWPSAQSRPFLSLVALSERSPLPATRHQNSAVQPLQPHSISTSRTIDFERINALP
jgi:hypothetical protein